MSSFTTDQASSDMNLYLRAEKEKADPEAWWRQPDTRLFAAGACHILAGVFCRTRPQPDFHPLLIHPGSDFRGTHVIVTDGSRAFDARGWTPLDNFLERYAQANRAVAPHWHYTVVSISDPLGWDFCLKYHHRHPTLFPHDPIPRARRFLERVATAPDIV